MTMYITEFNYHKPSTIEEACVILAESPDGVPLAGGTDLLVEMKQGLRRHQDVVSLSLIRELKSIHQDGGHLTIGAGATHNEVADCLSVRQHFPAIAEAASQIGTDQIRNAGTIGGNLCTGASCCDMAPILMALDAAVEIQGTGGTRMVSLDEFFISHRETRLQKGELMTRIIVPSPPKGCGSCYEKFGLREAASISVASVAAAIRVEGGKCSDCRIVIGAVAPTPKLSPGAGQLLKGRSVNELLESGSILQEAGAAAVADSLPIDDLRGSAEYRRHLIKTLTRRAILAALARANP